MFKYGPQITQYLDTFHAVRGERNGRRGHRSYSNKKGVLTQTQTLVSSDCLIFMHFNVIRFHIDLLTKLTIWFINQTNNYVTLVSLF